MPCQIVRLSATTIATILDLPSFSTAHSFGLRDMEMKETALPDGARALRVHLEPLVYCPELRSHFVNDVYALLILDEQSALPPALPRPLPDGLALHILNQTHSALRDLQEFSGHEHLEIAAAFELARAASALKANARRRAPANPYECALLDRGAILQKAIAPAIARLDRKLASYGALVAGSGLEAALIRLGLQAELGHRLKLLPSGNTHVAEMTGEGRRGGLNELIRVTENVLSTFQKAAEAIYDGEVENKSWLEPKALIDIHASLLAYVPGGESAGRLRTREMRIRSPIDGRIRTLELPGSEVREAFAQFAAGFDAALWRDHHAVVRLAMAHVECCRIHGFSDGNGRMARLLLQALMLESGLPALPLGAILEWNRARYLDHAARSVTQQDPLCFLRFLLSAIDEAIKVGRLMIRKLRPRCETMRDVFLTQGMCPRLAQVAPEFVSSMLIGPDPGLIRRTRHGVEISWWLQASRLLDEIDAKPLGFLLSGYDAEVAYSAPIARALLSGPLSLM